MREEGQKPMLILTSKLTKNPSYYASNQYTAYPDGRVVVHGKKYDVTTSVEAIVKERIEEWQQEQEKKIIQ